MTDRAPLPVQRDLWIASDLHLVSDHETTAQVLIESIDTHLQAGDRLVLAGDLFDAFAGEKAIFLDRYARVTSALVAAGERGVAIDVLEGNHDIHLRPWVARIPGARHHSEGVSLLWGARRVWVEHGDRVNQADYGYRALRAFFQSSLMRGVVQFSPDTLFDRFAQFASRTSRTGHPMLPESLPPDQLSALRRVYRESASSRLLRDFEVVVYGHCHDLDELRFDAGGRQVQYINMGFPPVHGFILRGPVGGQFLERAPLRGA